MLLCLFSFPYVFALVASYTHSSADTKQYTSETNIWMKWAVVPLKSHMNEWITYTPCQYFMKEKDNKLLYTHRHNTRSSPNRCVKLTRNYMYNMMYIYFFFHIKCMCMHVSRRKKCTYPKNILINIMQNYHLFSINYHKSWEKVHKF